MVQRSAPTNRICAIQLLLHVAEADFDKPTELSGSDSMRLFHFLAFKATEPEHNRKLEVSISVGDIGHSVRKTNRLHSSIPHALVKLVDIQPDVQKFHHKMRRVTTATHDYILT